MRSGATGIGVSAAGIATIVWASAGGGAVLWMNPGGSARSVGVVVAVVVMGIVSFPPPPWLGRGLV